MIKYKLYKSLCMIVLVGVTSSIDIQASNSQQNKYLGSATDENLPPSSASHDTSSDTHLILPSAAIMRQEVAKDPHATPASFIRFAKQVGARMEVSMKDGRSALALFQELKNCVNTKTPMIQVRLFCMSTAKRLALRHVGVLRHPYLGLAHENADLEKINQMMDRR